MKDLTIQILEKLEHKKGNITYSKDRTLGIEDAIGWIAELTGRKRCQTCKKWFKGLANHKNNHIQFK